MTARDHPTNLQDLRESQELVDEAQYKDLTKSPMFKIPRKGIIKLS